MVKAASQFGWSGPDCTGRVIATLSTFIQSGCFLTSRMISIFSSLVLLLCLAATDASLYQPPYPGSGGKAQVRRVREAICSGMRISLFQASRHAWMTAS